MTKIGESSRYLVHRPAEISARSGPTVRCQETGTRLVLAALGSERGVNHTLVLAVEPCALTTAACSTPNDTLLKHLTTVSPSPSTISLHLHITTTTTTMAGNFTAEAGAALVFLILYVLLWSYMTFMYAGKRYQWKSRYTILYLHTTIRVASQACGLAFAILAWRNIDVFVAYLILSAEGYFSLTIAAYYFLKHYEIKHFGWSRLGPADPNEGGKKRLLAALSMSAIVMPWRYWDRNLLMIVDAWLIPANAIIIAGGSIMAGLNDKSKQLDADDYNNRVNVSKGLRTAGQAVFLALTVVFVALLTNAARKGRGLKHSTERTMSKTAIAIFSTVGAMLLVRGIFGVL